MQYDFQLNSGQARVIDVSGRFLKYASGVGGTTLLRVILTNGGYIDLLPNQGVWNVEFQKIVLKNLSGATLVGSILAGDYDFQDGRIAGSVSVINGVKGDGYDLSFNQKAGFVIANANALAGASSYAAISYEPNAANSNLYIEKIVLKASLDCNPSFICPSIDQSVLTANPYQWEAAGTNKTSTSGRLFKENSTNSKVVAKVFNHTALGGVYSDLNAQDSIKFELKAGIEREFVFNRPFTIDAGVGSKGMYLIGDAFVSNVTLKAIVHYVDSP
jgi:hypothetical protein